MLRLFCVCLLAVCAAVPTHIRAGDDKKVVEIYDKVVTGGYGFLELDNLQKDLGLLTTFKQGYNEFLAQFPKTNGVYGKPKSALSRHEAKHILRDWWLGVKPRLQEQKEKLENIDPTTKKGERLKKDAFTFMSGILSAGHKVDKHLGYAGDKKGDKKIIEKIEKTGFLERMSRTRLSTRQDADSLYNNLMKCDAFFSQLALHGPHFFTNFFSVSASMSGLEGISGAALMAADYDRMEVGYYKSISVGSALGLPDKWGPSVGISAGVGIGWYGSKLRNDVKSHLDDIVPGCAYGATIGFSVPIPEVPFITVGASVTLAFDGNPKYNGAGGLANLVSCNPIGACKDHKSVFSISASVDASASAIPQTAGGSASVFVEATKKLARSQIKCKDSHWCMWAYVALPAAANQALFTFNTAVHSLFYLANTFGTGNFCDRFEDTWKDC